VQVELFAFATVVALLVGKSPNLWVTAVTALALLLERLFFNGEKIALPTYDKGIIATAVFLFVAVVLALTGAGRTFVNKHHNSFLAFEKRLESRLGLSGFAGYTDGYLSNSEPKKTHKTMLTALLSEKLAGNLYFRGFVGEWYKDGRWNGVDEDAFYSAMDSGDKSRLEVSKDTLDTAFNALLAGETSYVPAGEVDSSDAFLSEIDGVVQVTLYYPGVRDSYCYAPYYVSYSTKKNQLSAVGDANFIRKSDRIGEYAMMSPILLYMNEYEDKENKTYTEYVKNHYLEVPAELETTLYEFLGTNQVADIYDATVLVQQRLWQTCSYQTELGNLAFGEDYVKHFLKEEQKGYCCHFATAGTLLLRYLGIPARYVTGYCVGEDDFKENEQGEYQADIKDDSAHAWVEVYYEPLGWIPVEMTPGYDSDISAQDTLREAVAARRLEKGGEVESDEETSQSEPDDAAATQSETATTQSLTSEQTSTTQSQLQSDTDAYDEKTKTDLFGGQDKRTQRAVKIGAGVLAVLLLCAIIGLVWLLGSRRNQRLRQQEDGAKALAAIKKQMRRRLRKKGYQKEVEESEEQYLLRVVQSICKAQENEGGEEDAQMRAQLEQLARAYYSVLEKAAYSDESLTKGDIACANEFFDRIFKRMV
jgi:transglutaminase-like putative cysteine protease